MEDLQEVLVAEEFRLQARLGVNPTSQEEEAMFSKGKIKGKGKGKWTKNKDARVCK